MITTVQEAAIAALAAIPGVAQCKPYDGQFSGGTTRKVAVKAPAIFVAVLSAVPDADPGTDQLDLKCRFAAYVLARNARGHAARGADCVNLAERVALTIHQNQWGLSGLSMAVVERLDSLSNNIADKAGFALWGIPWQQTVRLGASVWDGAGVIPTEVYLGVTPNIGPGHIPDYWKVN